MSVNPIILCVSADNYQSAREKARDAEYTSSLDTVTSDAEKEKSRQKRKRGLLSELEDVEDTTNFPSVALPCNNSVRQLKKLSKENNQSFSSDSLRPLPAVPVDLLQSDQCTRTPSGMDRSWNPALIITENLAVDAHSEDDDGNVTTLPSQNVLLRSLPHKPSTSRQPLSNQPSTSLISRKQSTPRLDTQSSPRAPESSTPRSFTLTSIRHSKHSKLSTPPVLQRIAAPASAHQPSKQDLYNRIKPEFPL